MKASDTMDTLEQQVQLVANSADLLAQARCNDGAGGLAELFFSEEIPDIRLAKQVCRECPVQIECLMGAIERREPAGVWGGELFVNGKILPVKRPRGRPPKHKPQLTA